MNEVKKQDQFINDNELQWNHPSKISAYWLSFVKKSPEKLTYQSYHEIYKKNPQKFIADHDVILRDIDEGRTDLEVWNFSMRTFLYKLQLTTKIEARINIKNVLEALMVKYPQIGYCQGMNYIIAYFLCFCEESSAFDLFSHLIDSVLPPRFFQKSEKGTGLLGVMAEKHVLKRLLQDCGLFQNKESLEKAEDFLELKAPQWLLSLLVNILDFEGIFYIFNMLFEWGYFTQVEKAILLIVHKKYDDFFEMKNDSSRITDSITRDISVNILQKMSEIPVDEKMRNQSYIEYMKEFAEKWNQTDRNTLRQLEKITYFKKEEIEMLQKEFLFLLEDREKHLTKKKKTAKHIDLEILKEENLEENLAENKKITKEKKTMNQIKGITKNDFLVIMSLMDKKKVELHTEDIERIFDIFDDDNSGTLDFREFLCCMSLLMRGNVQEKIEMCFNLFDKENKGYLINEEGIKMVQSLIKSLGLTINKEIENFEEKMDFFKNILLDNIKNKEKVTLLDFTAIELDPFVIEINRSSAKK